MLSPTPILVAYDLREGKSQQYGYDGWGNLTSKTGDGQNFTLMVGSDNRLYGAGICYDANGNMVAVQNGCGTPEYGYDISNRLMRAGSTLGGPERYWYTADNKRVTTLTLANGTVSQVFCIYGAKGEATMCSAQSFGSTPSCSQTELQWAGRVMRQKESPAMTDRVGSVVAKSVGVGEECLRLGGIPESRFSLSNGSRNEHAIRIYKEKNSDCSG